MRLSLGNTAQVGGGIYYVSENDLSRQDGAKVAGEVKRTEPAQNQGQNQGSGNFVWWFMLSMLVLALSLVLIAPRAFERSADLARQPLVMTFLVGFIACLLAPLAIVLTMITVVGIPLALLTAVAWTAVLGLSGPFAAYLVGRMVWREGKNAILIMAIGAIIIILLMLVPILNIFVFLAVLWFGVGSVLRLVWHSIGNHNYTVPPIATPESEPIVVTDPPAETKHRKKL
jgi:hypothetical protein